MMRCHPIVLLAGLLIVVRAQGQCVARHPSSSFILTLRFPLWRNYVLLCVLPIFALYPGTPRPRRSSPTCEIRRETARDLPRSRRSRFLPSRELRRRPSVTSRIDASLVARNVERLLFPKATLRKLNNDRTGNSRDRSEWQVARRNYRWLRK